MADQNDYAAGQTFPDAHLDEFSRIGDNILVEKHRPCDTFQVFTEKKIFEHRLSWKSAQMFEQSPSDKQRLIAIDNLCQSGAEIVQSILGVRR
jgi:hypothetical protein